MTLDPQQLVWLVTALVIAGLLAGMLAGLLGVGGGLVIVPVVYQVMLIAGATETHLMQVSVGTSLALIIPTSLRSALGHHRRGAVQGWLLRRWSTGLVVGVIAGVIAAHALTSDALALVFAILVLSMAAWLAWAPETFRLGDRLPSGAAGHAIPAGIGGLSALMGIGGGSLSVPVMTAYGIPLLRAVGTSSALGLMIALPGAAGFVIAGWQTAGLPPYSLGYVNLLAAACVLPTMLLAVPLGVRLAHHLSSRMLRHAFALFLVITGLRMAWAGLSA